MKALGYCRSRLTLLLQSSLIFKIVYVYSSILINWLKNLFHGDWQSAVWPRWRLLRIRGGYFCKFLSNIWPHPRQFPIFCANWTVYHRSYRFLVGGMIFFSFHTLFDTSAKEDVTTTPNTYWNVNNPLHFDYLWRIWRWFWSHNNIWKYIFNNPFFTFRLLS